MFDQEIPATPAMPVARRAVRAGRAGVGREERNIDAPCAPGQRGPVTRVAGPMRLRA
jgi:hypothetical protein